jgi:hypothetical protein
MIPSPIVSRIRQACEQPTEEGIQTLAVELIQRLEWPSIDSAHALTRALEVERDITQIPSDNLPVILSRLQGACYQVLGIKLSREHPDTTLHLSGWAQYYLNYSARQQRALSLFPHELINFCHNEPAPQPLQEIHPLPYWLEGLPIQNPQLQPLPVEYSAGISLEFLSTYWSLRKELHTSFTAVERAGAIYAKNIPLLADLLQRIHNALSIEQRATYLPTLLAKIHLKILPTDLNRHLNEWPLGSYLLYLQHPVAGSHTFVLIRSSEGGFIHDPLYGTICCDLSEVNQQVRLIQSEWIKDDIMPFLFPIKRIAPL